jgi:ribosomal subunit interface protein
MPFPLQVHLLDMTRSEAVEAKIRERAAKLERYAGVVQRCDVWVDSSHEHHRNGNLYAVRILLTVPGGEIAVDLQPAEEDVYVAIRQAFDAARRRLEDIERRREGRVKAHPRTSGDPSTRRRVPSRAERAAKDEKGAA